MLNGARATGPESGGSVQGPQLPREGESVRVRAGCALTKQALAASGRLAAAVATASPSPKLMERTEMSMKCTLIETAAGMVGSKNG